MPGQHQHASALVRQWLIPKEGPLVVPPLTVSAGEFSNDC
jgi:hypothetical protein